MTPTFALALVGGFLGLAWLVHEFRNAPVVEDDRGFGDEPFLSEEVRAALNGCEGYSIPSVAGLPVARAPGASNAPRSHRENLSGGVSSFRTPADCSGAVVASPRDRSAGASVSSPIHTTGE